MQDHFYTDVDKRLRELERENEELRIRLLEAEETLEAIQSGSVDAVVVDTEFGKQVFTLQGADYSYRELVETMNEGALTISPDHTVMYCNSRIAEMLKTSFDKITGNLIDQYIHPDDLPFFNSIINKALVEKTNSELRLKAADGEIIPVLLSCNPFSEESAGIWLIFTNLTELKRIQHKLELFNETLEYLINERTEQLKLRNEELRQSEEKFRHLTENASDLIWTLNLTKGKFTYIGPSVIRLSGFTVEEAMQHSLEDSLTPESVQKVSELIPVRVKEFTEDPENSKVYLDVFGQNCKDGSVKWIEATTKLQYNAAGEIEVIGVSRDITERKIAEEKLKESEERFTEAFNNNTAALSIARIEDGVILNVNESYSKLFGYSREELIGKSSLELNLFVKPSDRGETIRRLREKGQVTDMEIQGRTKDGRILTVLTSAGKIHIRGAEYVLWTAIDVTERKKAEEDIRRHSQLVESINQVLESVMHCETEEDLGAACLEIAGKLTQSKFGFIGEINFRGLEDITIGNPGWDVCKIMDNEGHRIPPGDFKIHGIYGKVVSGGKTLLTNDPSNHPDSIGLPAGHPPLESFLGVPLIREGKTIGLIAVANREGGYSAVEQESLEALSPLIVEAFMHLRSEKALHQTKAKLDLALDNANIGIWERDLKSNRSVWDKRTEKMFGFEEGSFDGSYETFEKCLFDEDLPHVRESIRKAIEENVPYETVYRVKLPDGSISHINAKGLVTHDENGDAVRLSGVCFDITNMQKGAEKALFTLNEELLRSNKDLEQFAYIASHDLQEPLRIVWSFSQLFEKRYNDKLDETGRQFIHYIVDGAQRSQQLINDLLAYSRVGTRGQEFDKVYFNEIVEKACNNLSLVIEDRKAEVICDKLPIVSGDPQQLVSLMQNLIGNAIKFCDKNPKVVVSFRDDKEHYTFLVKDNGIGIDHQYSEKIFLIFQRLMPREAYEGSGIGLAICKRIVERHGGKICFESKVGEGTTFYFTIAKNGVINKDGRTQKED